MIYIDKVLKDAVWDTQPPATTKSIQRLVAYARKDLPEVYLALLHHSDDGEGNLALECD